MVQGGFKTYDFNRMVVLFTIVDGDAEVSCAISTAAMDDLEGSTKCKAEQREAQFMRLRELIEKRAVLKFRNAELEGSPAGVVLRSIDFRS
jgi:hypothetical protein